MSKEIPNPELSLDEQVRLAEELRQAVDRRNALESQYPELEDLSVFVNGSPENREEHDRLWREYDEARKLFDEKVINKLWLVKHLRETGKGELATMIESMFGLEKLKY